MTPDSVIDLLRRRFAAAIARVTGQPVDAVDPQIRPAGDPRFGDYQCNAAMGLAKSLGAKPRELAQRIANAVELADVADPLERAGPGFINIRLSARFLAEYLGRIEGSGFGVQESAASEGAKASVSEGDRVGIPTIATPQRVVVDYSSPNIAKEMHVGHVRSTIIGDVLARVLRFLGHEVIRQNHVGDWGTAIGMVVAGLWYIESRIRRGEREADVAARLAKLGAPHLTADALEQLGRDICREWSEDLRNEELDRFAELDVTLDQLELGYRFVQKLCEVAEPRGWSVTNRDGTSEKLADIPRKVTRMLQQGGPANEPERQAWKRARQISLRYCQGIYDRLGVLLRPEDACGESFYQYESDRLGPVLTELREKLPPRDRSRPAPPDGWVELRDDQGAVCLFFYDGRGQPRFRDRAGKELPLLIRKSDGAYLYGTTDLAAMRYRLKEIRFPDGLCGGNRLIYVTGAPQKLHFAMLFAAGRAAGWAGPGVKLEHVSFGQVLGEDRKLLRTRTGGAVKLAELLDEAEARAARLLEEKLAAEDADYRASFSVDEKREIARRIGIGAVKYADLARDRNSDYVFSWDSMLALQGNTAPYLLYAYARIRSIYRKASGGRSSALSSAAVGEGSTLPPAGADQRSTLLGDVAPIVLRDPTERALALRLARLREAIDAVAGELLPHILCGYLYDLAADFMRFYEACPVLDAPDEATRRSRLRLCDLTARTLRLGLGLLGIETIERM